RDGKDYKTDKGRKLSFMRGIFISCWINHKKRKKLEGTLFGHPHKNEYFLQGHYTFFKYTICIFPDYTPLVKRL
ncbi:IS5/IS1182 family transposase, partial [Bacteroides fragilis]|nr:IS5/IS1182 family transposase [Bacteroides fragilis]